MGYIARPEDPVSEDRTLHELRGIICSCSNPAGRHYCDVVAERVRLWLETAEVGS